MRGLIQVNRADSQSWLYNFLISLLHDNNPTESIGAAIVLSQVLPDDHSKKEEVSNFLLGSSSNYLSYVLTSNPTRRNIRLGRKSIDIKNWFLETLINVLRSSKWVHITEHALNSGLEILEFSYDQGFKIAVKLCFSELEHKLFSILLKQNKNFSRSDYKIFKDYGFVEIFQLQPALVSEITEIELSQGIGEITGVFEVCYLVARFLKYKLRSEFIEIIKLFQGCNACLNSRLFYHLGVTPPIDMEKPIDAQIEKLNSITDNEIQELCLNKRKIHINDRKNTANLWKELVCDEPNFAFYLWAESPISKNENIKEMLNIIIDKVIKIPELLRNCPSLWGYFISEAPEHESELRNALVIGSRGTITDQSLTRSFYPFKLNLPSEISLLPHLINALITNRKRYYHETEKDRELDFLKKQISRIVDDTLSLKQIIFDSSQPKTIRSAGIIALLLHPDGNKELGGVKQLLVEFYNSKLGHWYTRAITICLRLLTTEEDPNAKWIVNSLLEASRADYEAREYLDGLLNLWRESSHSPTQKAGILDKWLSGNE